MANPAKILRSQVHLPQVIVFDLDYTLWPLWVDTHVSPPFQKLNNGDIIDRHRGKVKLYPDVVGILEAVKEKGIQMAVASRTGAIDVAESLLEIMDLDKYFAAKQIYPGSKVSHFSHFQEKLNVPFEKMLFYDDEERNIRDLTKVGVTAVLVPDGLSNQVFCEGLELFSKKT